MKGTWQGFLPRIYTLFGLSLLLLLFGRFCKLIEPGLVGLPLFPLLDILLCLLHPLSIFFSEGFEGSWFVGFSQPVWHGIRRQWIQRCMDPLKILATRSSRTITSEKDFVQVSGRCTQSYLGCLLAITFQIPPFALYVSMNLFHQGFVDDLFVFYFSSKFRTGLMLITKREKKFGC